MRKWVLTKLLLLFVCVNGYGDSDPGEDGKVLVTMRKIGHEVLLQSGDTTSWVLPVEKVSATVFRLKFEAPFSFTPESLVQIIHHHLEKDKLPLTYLVEVSSRKDKKVVYSYEVTGSLKNSTIPCLQRNPPKGRYEISVRFSQNPVQTSSLSSTGKFLWFLLPVLFLGVAWKFFNRVPIATISQESILADHLITIGQLTFCLEKQILKFGNERIELSAKESKILKIFLSAPNEVIGRDQLMKQVWEDEGVFVGRSLDVFVSQLRKKLQPEASVRIVNIHGKGYKLEVVS